MHYWNKDNFEGLTKVAESYRSIEGYEDFAQYCLLKEKGLRKKAHESIENFIKATERKKEREQRKVAEQLAELSYHNRHIHQLIPHQLHQFLLTVLRKWAEAEAHDATPHRWLGYIGNELNSYLKALEIEPTDTISLVAVINFYLNRVDYQTHHLSESFFIGEIAEAKKSLDQAEALLGRLEATEQKDVLTKEYQYYRNLITSWEAYKHTEATIGFPQWVEARGEKYSFSQAYYYDSSANHNED